MMFASWKMLSFLGLSTMWMMQLGSAATNAPTPAPTITRSKLTDTLEELASYVTPLADLDILNTELPLLGKTINELIGGAEGKSIDSLLDLSEFVNAVGNAELTKAELATELEDYLKKLDPVGIQTLTCPLAGNAVVVVEWSTDTVIVVTFCAGFSLMRSATLNAEGLFDEIADVIEVDLEFVASVEASLLFSATFTLDLESPETTHITLNPIEAEVKVGGNFDITVGLGMLDLTSNATVVAQASFGLEYCTGGCPVIGSGEQLGTSDFYLERFGNYSMSGDVALDADFPGVPDLTLARFSIEEPDLFSPSPVVEVTGFNKSDFVTFSPENAVTLYVLLHVLTE
jgi:hypothetical protein